MSAQLWTGLTSYNLDRRGLVDKSEKIGTFLYTPLCIVAGREYKVIKNKSFKEQDSSSLITRVITCVVSILLSPILLCTTLVGYGLLKYSTSYQACFTKHQQVVDRAAQKAVKNEQPVKKEDKPLNLDDLDKVEEEARTSTYIGSGAWNKLESLSIFKQTQEASLKEIPAIMKGAFASSDYSANVIAVIVAILKQIQADDQQIYRDKLDSAKKAVSEDQWNEIIRDPSLGKEDSPQSQLLWLEEQQLDFILKYKDQLALSPAIVTKMEETVAYIAKLKEESANDGITVMV